MHQINQILIFTPRRYLLQQQQCDSNGGDFGTGWVTMLFWARHGCQRRRNRRNSKRFTGSGDQGWNPQSLGTANRNQITLWRSPDSLFRLPERSPYGWGRDASPVAITDMQAFEIFARPVPFRFPPPRPSEKSSSVPHRRLQTSVRHLALAARRQP